MHGESQQWNGNSKNGSNVYFRNKRCIWIKDQWMGLTYDWKWQEKTYVNLKTYP